jgi:hypothetical protein
MYMYNFFVETYMVPVQAVSVPTVDAAPAEVRHGACFAGLAAASRDVCHVMRAPLLPVR